MRLGNSFISFSVLLVLLKEKGTFVVGVVQNSTTINLPYPKQQISTKIHEQETTSVALNKALLPTSLDALLSTNLAPNYIVIKNSSSFKHIDYALNRDKISSIK